MNIYPSSQSHGTYQHAFTFVTNLLHEPLDPPFIYKDQNAPSLAKSNEPFQVKVGRGVERTSTLHSFDKPHRIADQEQMGARVNPSSVLWGDDCK